MEQIYFCDSNIDNYLKLKKEGYKSLNFDASSIREQNHISYIPKNKIMYQERVGSYSISTNSLTTITHKEP